MTAKPKRKSRKAGKPARTPARTAGRKGGKKADGNADGKAARGGAKKAEAAPQPGSPKSEGAAGTPGPAPRRTARPGPPTPEGAVERLFLIDGHAAIYRAYFAIKSRLSAPGTGKATHAAFGFTKIVRSLLEKEKPEYLAVAMDSPGPTFRHEVYAAYKANRPEMPEDMRPQIGMVERICDAYGIPVHSAPRYEADDVIGTLAEQGAAKGLQVVIVSGDKDLLQLVRGKEIVVLDPTPGKGGGRAAEGGVYFDADGVREAKGVPPERIVDLLGLAGDSSDNIPGVKGVGPKKATALVKEHGSLEAAIEAARAGKVKGKLAEYLTKDADNAILSRELATIDRKAPVELDLEAAHVKLYDGRADEEKLIAVFKELGFRGFLASIVPSGEKEDLRYTTVDTPEALGRFVKELGKQERFAFDTETDSERPRAANLVGLSFSWKAKEAWYVPVRAPEGERRLDEARVLEALRGILEDPARRKVAQNAKYDMIVLRRAGVELGGLDFDTMVASYLLEPGSRSHGIDSLAVQHLGFRKIATSEVIGKGKSRVTMDRVPVATVARYACEDADICWRLCGILEKRLRDFGFEELHADLELPLVDVLAEIEWNGIAVDGEALAGLSAGMAEVLATKEKEIHAAAGREFNVNSTRQLNDILYGELGLPVLKKTPKGQPSTDSDVLASLAERHELPKLLLGYRELSKLKSTYADALPAHVNPETGRIHASLNQTVTATGRLSSSDPNLQNIPVRTERGQAIRQCFVAGEPGWKLLSADYSQVELRLLAHMSGDERMVDAFREGKDIHAAVAAELAGCAISDVTPAQRRRAKTVNFGLMYGQGAQHLARSTGMTLKEADGFIRDYFRRFDGVTKLKRKVLDNAREEGKVSTMLGRVRYLPEIGSDDIPARRAAERMAFNTVIQGSAADLMKRAMVDIHRELLARDMRSRMILQIHDELLFESPEEELDELDGLVTERMSGALELDVPLVVDTGAGDNWLDVK